MRWSLVCAISITSSVAAADHGPLIETKLSATHWDGTLGDHIEMPDDQPGDGGYALFGYRIGDWSVEGGLIAHDVQAVRGGHDDALAGFGVDARRYVPIASHLELSFRAGLDHMWLYRQGMDGTPLETARGPGVHGGVGLGYRTVTCDQAAVVITAEVFRHDVWLHADDVKPITGGGTSFVLGIEYQGRTTTPKKKCVW